MIRSYTQGINDDTLRTEHQSDLFRAQQWCQKNAILMNVKKTKSTVFGMRHGIKNLTPLNFQIDGNVPETVPHYKYLGTYVDSKLNFTRRDVQNDFVQALFLIKN